MQNVRGCRSAFHTASDRGALSPNASSRRSSSFTGSDWCPRSRTHPADACNRVKSREDPVISQPLSIINGLPASANWGSQSSSITVGSGFLPRTRRRSRRSRPAGFDDELASRPSPCASQARNDVGPHARPRTAATRRTECQSWRIALLRATISRTSPTKSQRHPATHRAILPFNRHWRPLRRNSGTRCSSWLENSLSRSSNREPPVCRDTATGSSGVNRLPAMVSARSNSHRAPHSSTSRAGADQRRPICPP